LTEKIFQVGNGSSWYEKTVSPNNGASFHERTVKVGNGSAWYTSYPRESYWTETFNATWSQGWRGDGVPLHDTSWYGNIITGSTTNYRGMLGFNRDAMRDFIADGIVTDVRLLINCYETTANGSPDVQIGKHIWLSEPYEGWNWNGSEGADWSDYTPLHVPNQALGGYWVVLRPSQMSMGGGTIGGVALRGATATNEDMGKFNGVGSFTSKLQITVLK
jgi:hypothetical protein